MKKLTWLILCFISCFTACYAGGGITHMYLAYESIAFLHDAQQRQLLIENLDPYFVGSYYPDSGYIKGNLYGDDSHWDEFIIAFLDYLNNVYTDPIKQNPQLVSFLFGCAAHRVSDEIIHWTFYEESKNMDFNGSYDNAHYYSDTGIDILLNIDKNLWIRDYPGTWWVPVPDLVAVYKRMGKPEYTAEQIIYGNIFISFAGYGERLISAAAYPYYKWKMPWTSAHYYDWPKGGIQMDVLKIAEYQSRLWEALKNKTVFMSNLRPAKLPELKSDSYAIQFAEQAIKKGIVIVDYKTNKDGSIEILRPIVKHPQQLQSLTTEYLQKIKAGK